MSEHFSKDRVDFGFTKVPHGLWIADMSHGAKCLLGWLWSHDDEYLAKLSVRRIGVEFGGGGQVVEWLRDLAAKGYVTKINHNGQYEVRLIGKAWTALGGVRKPNASVRKPNGGRDGNRTVTATETEHIEDQGEDQGEDQSETPLTPRKRGALAAVDDQFDNEFWPHYPKGKPGKGQAREYWRSRKMTQADRAAAVEGIQRHVAWWREQGTEQQFIPASIVWLHQRRWEDDEPRQRLQVVDTDKVLRSRQRRAQRAALQNQTAGSQT